MKAIRFSLAHLGSASSVTQDRSNQPFSDSVTLPSLAGPCIDNVTNCRKLAAD